MSSGKQTYIRYRIINQCFVSRVKKHWTIDELMEKLADYDILVGKRTIENDFRAMREDSQVGFYAPIVYSKYHKAFHYSDPEYNTEKIPIAEDQIELLEIATRILGHFQGMHFFNALEETVEKLGNTVKNLRKKGDAIALPFILFEEAAWQDGLQHLEPLIFALKEKTALTIDYHAFDKSMKNFVFHPYFLVQYRQRWYLGGHSEWHHQLLTLGLDRIESFVPAKTTFRPADLLDPKAYFQNIIGISYANGKVEEIVLKFSPASRHYIKTQHLHSSQTTLGDDESGLTIRLQVTINFELTSIIMSYMPEVEVISPAHLREQIKQMLQKGMNKHLG